MFLDMSPALEEPASVASRLGRRMEEIAPRLEDMASRGLLFRMKKAESVKYGAIPFMHGLMEFQVKRLDRSFSELMEQYFAEGFHGAIAGTAGMFLRTIPVQQSVMPEHRVAAYDDAVELLKKAPVIVVAECVCRKEKKTLDRGCDKPLETCFMFGSMARYYIDNAIGRQVDLNEAVRILADSQKAGLVTQPATAQNPSGMCNCCGDCCGVLGAIKKFPRPAEFVFSNYQASADAAACTGCEVCLDRCQMEAIAMTPGGTAEVNRDRCIGCGLCVTTCPAEALSLKAKEGAGLRVPPATSGEQMLLIAKNRGLI
jgi:Pyruvate/2-oxoacid:ferredoxin oxidoreductase delta subunit